MKFWSSTPRPAAITSLPIPGGLRMLVIGPHPDDFDANGVTLRYLHENGSIIRVAVISGGSGVEDSYCWPPTLEVKEKIRQKEQRESCRFFGLDDASLIFLKLENDSEDQPIESEANRGILTELITSFRPDIVFIPHGNDTNQAHRTVYAMVKDVLSRIGFPVTAFLSRDPKTISMHTDLFMPFDEEQAEWKAQLLRFHDTQHQRNLNTRGHGLDDRILAVNRLIASELGLDAPYAEAFELGSEVE